MIFLLSGTGVFELCFERRWSFEIRKNCCTSREQLPKAVKTLRMFQIDKYDQFR